MDEDVLAARTGVYDTFILRPDYTMDGVALSLEVWHAYYHLMASGNAPWIARLHYNSQPGCTFPVLQGAPEIWES